VLFTGAGAALVAVGAAYSINREMGSMAEYTVATASLRTPLEREPPARDLLRYATLAANSHNTQPWRFTVGEREISILPDFSRQLPAVDPDNHHLFASLGCAAENLAIAVGMRGKPGVLAFEPANGGRLILRFESGPAEEPALFDAIGQRQSTRGLFDGRSVSASDLMSLSQTAAVPGVHVILISERAQINRVRDLVIAGNTMQMADAAFIKELKAWLRFSPRHASQRGDGLFAACSGNPVLPEWAGPPIFDLMFNTGAENDKYARQIDSSAGIAVFVGQKDDPEHWVLSGRACQRFALAATSKGMKHAFINQPVEVAGLRPELADLVGMSGRRPDIVMRFGYGPALPFSARRAVDAVLA
jgi:hypothetical protein